MCGIVTRIQLKRQCSILTNYFPDDVLPYPYPRMQ